MTLIFRNAIIVIVCLLVANMASPSGCEKKDGWNSTNCPFTLTGEISAGLPSFQPPPFSFNPTNSTDSEDSEETKYQDFGGMLKTLGSAVIIIPMIAILESVAIAKAFGNWKL